MKDYFRTTGGQQYKWYKKFFMPYECKLLYWLRKTQFKPNFLNRFIYKHIREKHGNEIPREVKIGPGLYLGHLGPRFINSDVSIGSNCNINQNVTIGQENRGTRKGIPTIGNNVWLGANCVVVGKIIIGDNVLIAPNSFVNFDVPDNSIVIGNPAHVVPKENATESYINNVV